MMSLGSWTLRWSRHASAVALAIGLAVPVPSIAHAQVAIPSLTQPKQAAQRAAAAANAHTAASQNVDAATQPQGQAHQGAAPAQPPRPAATPVKLPTPKSTQPAPPLASQPTGRPATTAVATSKDAGKGKDAGKAKAPAAATAGKNAPPPVQAPVATPASRPTPAPVLGDSGGTSISVTQRGVKGEVSLNREVFSYDAGARRDPFISLMKNGDLRPMLSDLKLVTVLYDATGRNSIAIFRDVSTKDQYRVRVGVTLGRMRVVQIQPRQVVFTIEEVGFSRQETLALGDSTKARTP